MFNKGFEKEAMMDLAGVGKSALKLAKNPTVVRNTAIGAGTGAVAGAANNKENRFAGAFKGALVGGATGGAATAGYKKYKQFSAAKASKQMSFAGV